MELPDLVLFDLDGTLVDSTEDITRACNHALVAFGRAPLPSSAVAPLVGDGARALVARAFELPPSSSEVDAPLAAFHAFYAEHPADATLLVSGMEELLAWLAPRARLGVCTNKPRAITVRVLEVLGLRERMTTLWAGGDGPLKPDPAGIHACCTELGVPASRTMLVGDSPQDVLAGQRAGATTCAIATGIFVAEERLRAASPGLFVRDAAELLSVLRAAHG